MQGILWVGCLVKSLVVSENTDDGDNECNFSEVQVNLG